MRKTILIYIFIMVLICTFAYAEEHISPGEYYNTIKNPNYDGVAANNSNIAVGSSVLTNTLGVEGAADLANFVSENGSGWEATKFNEKFQAQGGEDGYTTVGANIGENNGGKPIQGQPEGDSVTISDANYAHFNSNESMFFLAGDPSVFYDSNGNFNQTLYHDVLITARTAPDMESLNQRLKEMTDGKIQAKIDSIYQEDGLNKVHCEDDFFLAVHVIQDGETLLDAHARDRNEREHMVYLISQYLISLGYEMGSKEWYDIFYWLYQQIQYDALAVIKGDDIDIPTPKVGSSCEITDVPYQHLEPERHGKIYNSGELPNKYEVTKAIPVDEELTYEVYNTDDVLYDINTRVHTLRAWARHLSLSTSYTYTYTYKYKIPRYKKNNKGKQVLDHYDYYTSTIKITGTAEDTDWSAVDAVKKYYDVNKSDIWTLYSATLKAEQGDKVLSASKDKLFESKAVGPQTIQTFHHNPAVSYSSSGKGGNIGTNPSASTIAYYKSLANQNAQDLLTKLKKSNQSAVDSAIGLRSGHVDYKFNNLEVHTTDEEGGHNFTEPGWDSVGAILDPNPGQNPIPLNYPNGTYDGSGTVTYKGGPGDKTFDIEDVNDVIIHTPVVCDPIIKIEPILYDQLERAAIERGEYIDDPTPLEAGKQKNMQLDSIGYVKVPDSGTHINVDIYPRYGSRKYNKEQGVTGNHTSWGEFVDIKFPFDVYIQNVNEVNPATGEIYKIKQSYYIKANKWLTEGVVDWNLSHTKPEDKIKSLDDVQQWVEDDPDMNDSGMIFTFVLPVWVDEDVFSGIQVRTIAINAPVDDKYDVNMTKEAYKVWNDWMEKDEHKRPNANMIDENTIDPNLYVATNDDLGVCVFGKIYDLQVNNSRDPDWINKLWITDKFMKDRGSPRDYVTANEAPLGQINQNRNVAYKYASKLGYTFSFNFKTKGRKSSQINVSVAPEGFYFVSKAGGRIDEVDLYYSKSVYNAGNRYIKIGSSDDKAKLTTRIADSFLKVVPQEMTDSGRIYSSEPLNKWGNKGPYHYENPVEVGSLSKLKLPHALRLTYNNILECKGGEGAYQAYDVVKQKGGLALYGRKTDENTIYSNASGKDYFIGSVGRWYCGYTLPATTVAVNKGADPNNPNNIKKDGYILVRLNIKSDCVKEIIGSGRDATIIFHEYLKYTGPEYINDSKFPGVEWHSNPDDEEKLRNDTRSPLTYYEKKDFEWYKNKYPNKKLDNGRKYETIVFNRPQFEWLKELRTAGYEYQSEIDYISGGKTGDADMGFVAVFETDYRATQDYDLSGTH